MLFKKLVTAMKGNRDDTEQECNDNNFRIDTYLIISLYRERDTVCKRRKSIVLCIEYNVMIESESYYYFPPLPLPLLPRPRLPPV